MGCHSLLPGIFPTQGSNPGLLHFRQISYHLSNQKSQPYVTQTEFKLVFHLKILHCDFWHNTFGSLPLTFFTPASASFISEKWSSKSLFRTKEIQFFCHCFKSGLRLYSFLHPETVHYHHAQFTPLLPDATTAWPSCFSEQHLLLLTMTTPEGCSQANSTKMLRASTTCQVVCYLLEIRGHAIKNK